MTYTKSHELLEQARRVIAGGVNSSFRAGAVPFPLFFDHARGAHIWDADGNEYIDYMLGQGPLILGHSNPAVLEEVVAELSKGQLYAGQHRLEIEVAELIVNLLPGVEQVRFANSGSEAVQCAIRLARAATGRRKIVKFEGHYHGWMDNILVSVLPSQESAGDGRRPTPVLGSAGQSTAALDEVIPLQWNDAAAVEAVLDAEGADIAAVLMTPVITTRAVIPPAEGYLQAVRDLCRRHGVLLIFDEVHTGFRVHAQGAQGLFGVEADIVVLGKALANGFPLAAIGAREELMRLIADRQVDHAGTFNTNIPCMAAAKATLNQLIKHPDAVYGLIAQRGSALLEGLRGLLREYAPDLKLQGFPALFSMAFTSLDHISNYRDCWGNDVSRYRELVAALMARGIRPTERGVWYLSAAHSDDDIDRTLDSMSELFRATHA